MTFTSCSGSGPSKQVIVHGKTVVEEVFCEELLEDANIGFLVISVEGETMTGVEGQRTTYLQSTSGPLANNVTDGETSMSDLINITLAHNGGAGFAGILRIPSGTTLRQFCVQELGGECREAVLTVNGKLLPPDQAEVYVLQDGDSVVALAAGERNEKQMPKLRQFEKHLTKTFGCIPVSRGGKGDHRKFKHPDGWSIDVNPSKRDRKELDIATFDALVRATGLRSDEVYKRVMSPI